MLNWRGLHECFGSQRAQASGQQQACLLHALAVFREAHPAQLSTGDADAFLCVDLRCRLTSSELTGLYDWQALAAGGNSARCPWYYPGLLKASCGWRLAIFALRMRRTACTLAGWAACWLQQAAAVALLGRPLAGYGHQPAG